MITLEANTKVTLVLKAQDVQVILAGLGELPYKLSYAVVDQINAQLQALPEEPPRLKKAK